MDFKLKEKPNEKDVTAHAGALLDRILVGSDEDLISQLNKPYENEFFAQELQAYPVEWNSSQWRSYNVSKNSLLNRLKIRKIHYVAKF